MSKRLTTNARWIVALVEPQPAQSSPPYRLVMNTGRHSWSTLEVKALTDFIDFSRCKLISTFYVDVEIYKYAKDWQKVSEAAEKWFLNQRLLSKKDEYYSPRGVIE